MLRIHAALAALTALVSCTSHTTPGPGSYFLQNRHREAFALGAGDLTNAKFYVTGDILAKGPTVVYLTMTDVGRVVDGGPDWLRIRFDTGTEIVFRTDSASGDPTYYLATEIDGRSGYHIVKNLDDRYLIHGGQRLEFDYGSDSGLLINSEDLQGLMDARERSWKANDR